MADDAEECSNAAEAEMLSMFQIADPITNQTIELDELFNDIYYMDLPGAPPAPPPDERAAAADNNMEPNQVVLPTPVAATTTTTTSTTEPQTIESSAPGTASTSTTTTAVTTTSGQKRKASAASALLLDSRPDSPTASIPTKDLTEQQKVERRERNREHAKRSRLRKKFLLESLQEQIHGLEEELTGLKEAIQREIPDRAEDVIKSVCGDKEKFTALPMPSGFGPVKTLMEPDFRLMTALSGSQQNFAISDPTLPDNPIVYVSQGFLSLTGYTLDQVLGRNCRFLQGPGTDQKAVEVIRKGITDGVDTSVCLLNYRADGSPFWNQFFVAALRDAEDNIVNYVGVQCEVSKAVVEKHLGEEQANAK